MTGISLDGLNNDILTYIFTILSIPEILLLRRVSRRLHLVSKQYIVWKTVCTNEILANGIPFSKRPLTSFAAKDLEERTLHAHRLGLNWMSPTTTLRRVPTASYSRVCCVKFVFHRDKSWIITTYLGTAWCTVNLSDCDSFEIVAQWCHGLFYGVAVNKDDQSDAAFAISVHDNHRTTVQILGISDNDAHGKTVKPHWLPQRTLDTSNEPIGLDGDLIALCGYYSKTSARRSKTLVLNWRTDEQALLKSPDTCQDKPRDVVFTNGSILVVGYYSVCIYNEPQMVLPDDELHAMLPRAFKSFNSADDVSLTLCGPPSQPSISLLVRTRGPDSRSTDQFQFMTLNPDFDRTELHNHYNDSVAQQDSSPSLFNLISSFSFDHLGLLQCTRVVLGPFGTAVWIDQSQSCHERLVVALLPGLLNRSSLEVQIKAVVGDDDWEQWTCLDYDEIRGLIALGSYSGGLAVYQL